MEASVRKVRGLVAPFSGRGESRVVVRDGDLDYRVLPRGAGVDLAEEVGASVEVEGLVREEAEGEYSIQVRSYRILDENLDEFDEQRW